LERVDLATLQHRRVPKLAEVTISRRENVTEDLWLIWIEKPEGFTFKPGQYCTIGRDGVERAYSIVSAPHEEALELFVELVPLPDGVLTPKLWELQVGDSVTIRPRAKGIFVFKPESPNQVLVSTVTGVVPYISILRDYVHRGLSGHHFYVLQGASYLNEFTYDGELGRLSIERPELVTYIPTVSRPDEERNAEWTGETGRVNLIVEPYVEKFGLAPEDTLIYACGHPGMIEDIKERMKPKGFQVDEERFWKQD
jgi:NAD(P)H-flavin reductase